MNKEIIEDLLDNVLNTPKRTQWKGDKLQFCCTVHGESNPSAGIHLNYTQEDGSTPRAVFNCFSCGASGSIEWLVYKSMPDQFKNLQEVIHYLNKRYGDIIEPEQRVNRLKEIKHYEDFMNTPKEERSVMPLYKLAPLKSGKETYQYFFSRGFDKEDMKKFMVGRDLNKKTITIPVFWEDSTLAGIIGRFISSKKAKNERYWVYDFSKSKLLFPLDKLEIINDTLIGCESMLDVMMLHKWGIFNSVAIMGDVMSKEQASQIINRCRVFIDLFDNDKGGLTARESAIKRLGGHVMYLTPTYYPPTGKDPCEWGKKETLKVIASATLSGLSDIPKL